jgi:hypothetical protein
MEYKTYQIDGINARRNPCYIFEGGIIDLDDDGLICLINTD